MPDIKNDQQLNKLMMDITEKVIAHIAEDLSKKLQEQIEKDVFTTPNDWYVRTGQFEKAWKWTDVKRLLKTMTTELYYDSSEVVHNPKRWEHGNPYESAVENLADILNLAYNGYKAGYTSSMKFGRRHFSHRRRPYWKNFIEKLLDKGELSKLFEAEFKQYGVVKVS
jgi:hypothetical protein